MRLIHSIKNFFRFTGSLLLYTLKWMLLIVVVVFLIASFAAHRRDRADDELHNISGVYECAEPYMTYQNRRGMLSTPDGMIEIEFVREVGRSVHVINVAAQKASGGGKNYSDFIILTGSMYAKDDCIIFKIREDSVWGGQYKKIVLDKVEKEVYQKPVDTLPDMEKFTDANYRRPSGSFSAPVASVVLISGDQQTEIAVDDPQLTALINFLAFSDTCNYNGMVYTAYFEDDIAEFRETHSHRLEIEFDNSEHPNAREKCTRLILSEDQYMLCYEEQGGGVYAYLIFPYAALAQRENIPWGLDAEMWLDVLAYAGF